MVSEYLSIMAEALSWSVDNSTLSEVFRGVAKWTTRGAGIREHGVLRCELSSDIFTPASGLHRFPERLLWIEAYHLEEEHKPKFMGFAYLR